MSNLKIFTYNAAEVRTVTIDGEPWFVLKDVCVVLEIGNSRMVAERLDDDEKGVSTIDTLGGKQEMTVISESGLYDTIFLSRKPEAKQFKRWITHEVLPAIRKHGGYLTPATIEEALLNPDTLIRLATDLKAEREKRAALESQIEADRPKIAFANACTVSEDCKTINELAKLLNQNGYETGQNRTYADLRRDGYLCKHGELYNLPTQRAADMELFKIKEITIHHPDGTPMIKRQTFVTGKGLQYFVNKYCSKQQTA